MVVWLYQSISSSESLILISPSTSSLSSSTGLSRLWTWAHLTQLLSLLSSESGIRLWHSLQPEMSFQLLQSCPWVMTPSLSTWEQGSWGTSLCPIFKVLPCGKVYLAFSAWFFAQENFCLRSSLKSLHWNGVPCFSSRKKNRIFEQGGRQTFHTKWTLQLCSHAHRSYLLKCSLQHQAFGTTRYPQLHWQGCVLMHRCVSSPEKSGPIHAKGCQNLSPCCLQTSVFDWGFQEYCLLP